jgi:hypothetical protein
MSSHHPNLAPSRNWVFTWNNPASSLIAEGLLPDPGLKEDAQPLAGHLSPTSSEGTVCSSAASPVVSSLVSEDEVPASCDEVPVPDIFFDEEALVTTDDEELQSPASSGHCSPNPRRPILEDAEQRAGALAYPAERISDLVFERLSAVRHLWLGRGWRGARFSAGSVGILPNLTTASRPCCFSSSRKWLSWATYLSAREYVPRISRCCECCCPEAEWYTDSAWAGCLNDDVEAHRIKSPRFA